MGQLLQYHPHGALVLNPNSQKYEGVSPGFHPKVNEDKRLEADLSGILVDGNLANRVLSQGLAAQSAEGAQPKIQKKVF